MINRINQESYNRVYMVPEKTGKITGLLDRIKATCAKAWNWIINLFTCAPKEPKKIEVPIEKPYAPPPPPRFYVVQDLPPSRPPPSFARAERQKAPCIAPAQTPPKSKNPTLLGPANPKWQQSNTKYSHGGAIMIQEN